MFISNYIYDWLDNALDYGIPEKDFWEMTIAELTRAINSKKRVKKIQEQEHASFDYILADLIGRSVGRIYNSSNKIPEIEEAYPKLFNSEEFQKAKKEKQDELSTLRFRLFAESFNKKFKEVAKSDE